MAPSKPPSFGSVDVRLGDGDVPEPRPADPGSPFRLLVVGDFTARQSRGAHEAGAALASRATAKVDVDTLDTVLGRLQPEISISLPDEGSARLRFRELEDFHPDRIFDRVPRFASLRDSAESLASRPKRPAPTADLLGRILDGVTEEERLPQPTDSPEGTLTALMRAILLDPAYRSLEAAWRGVDFLLRRLDLDSDLSVHLLDLSREELATDLLGGGDVARTALHQILVEKTVGTPGGVPWGAVVLLHELGSAPKDLALAWRLAQASSPAGTPVLCGASARLLGCDSIVATPDPDDWDRTRDADLADAWDSIRSVPEARWIGMALPRLLLRLPYGRRTEPVEAFDFEELSDPPAQDEYLWGAGALAPALLIAEAFLADGWSLRPGQEQEISGLPLAFEEADGEKTPKPCAETLMTVRAAQAIGDLGLMPLLTMKGTDVVRLGIFQSIAHPQAPLSGRWKG